MKQITLPVLFVLAPLAVQAEVNIVSGNVYDVGKGYYSADSGVEDNADKNLCWAAASANVFQHWQDRYLTDTTGIPDGIVPDAELLSYPGGTQYLEIYKTFQANCKDKAGYFSNAVDWYFNGKTGSYLDTGAAKAGYLPGMVGSYYDLYYNGADYDSYDYVFKDLKGLQGALDNVFRYEGVAVYLGIITPGGGHAITCWGYETDADGNLNALYVTDSDDRHYGARRVDVSMAADGKIALSSDYPGGSYSSGTYTINEVSRLVSTSETDPFAEKSGNVTLDDLPVDGGITQARDITGKKLSSSTGITTLPESMLVSSGGEGTSLTLGGGEERAAGDGFTALAGSMTSLNNAEVSISRFEGDGVSVQCEVNMSGGSVSVKDNGGTGISVRGTVDNPKAFLRMCDNSSIDISGNDQGALFVGKGYLKGDKVENGVVRDAALLRNNGSVTFSGNGTAARDAVVYNAGTLTVEDNGSVTFSGNAAKYDIYNDGKLTIVANEGQSVTFEHGVKNSATGTATLGAGSAGTYAFNDGDNAVSLTFASATIGAGGGMVMENGTLTQTNVTFSGAVTVDLGFYADMNCLELANVRFASDSNVSFILDLGSGAGGFMLLASAGEGSLTEVKVALKDYIKGDVSALTGVDFDLTVTGTLAEGAMLVIDTEGFDLDSSSVYVPDCKYKTSADGKIYYGVPEPTTATLSLLALAALCARRRRK